MSPSLEHFLSSTLRCCGWAYGCILIDVLHVQVGVNFRKNGEWPSVYDVAVSWLRLQTPIDCIPHPYSILDVYEVFEHLEMLWMEIWVHTYAVLHVQVGVNFRKNGEWPRLYDVAVSCLRLLTPVDCIPHPYWMYKSVLAAWDAVDGHMGASLHCYTRTGGGEF